MKKLRNTDIQLFRGLAIIAVVFNHSCSNSTVFSDYGQSLVNFAVPLFIFLSGYLTKLHYDNYFEFCKKRVLRVFIPYVVWSLLYCMCSYDDLQLSRVIMYILTGKACFPFYYIIVYIQFVLFTKWISKFVKSKYSIIGFIVTPLYFLCFRYLPLVAGQSVHPILSELLGISILPWFTFYYLGLYLRNKLELVGVKSLLFLWLIISISLQLLESVLLKIMGHPEMCGSGSNISSFFTSLCMCFVCVNFINKVYSKRIPAFLSETLVIIGNCSFGIYLIHILIRDSIRFTSQFVQKNEFIPLFIEGLIVLIVLIVSTFMVLGLKKSLPEKINNIIGF